jgi:hypothetical protein
MQVGRKRCSECGKAQEALPNGEAAQLGTCTACGAQLDGDALSKFASRLARFGLGATPQPLLSRLPELPNAK